MTYKLSMEMERKSTDTVEIVVKGATKEECIEKFYDSDFDEEINKGSHTMDEFNVDNFSDDELDDYIEEEVVTEDLEINSDTVVVSVSGGIAEVRNLSPKISTFIVDFDNLKHDTVEEQLRTLEALEAILGCKVRLCDSILGNIEECLQRLA